MDPYDSQRGPAPDDLPKCFGDWHRGPPLGTGVTGTVWLVAHQSTGRQGALKVLRRGQVERARLELVALRTVDVPGVARWLDSGIEHGHLWVVMELAPGSPFPGRPSPLAWPELRPIVVRLLRVLAALHEQGLFHLDLKPDNILVDGDEVTVVDFGLASGPAVGAARSGARLDAGTPGYVAPEQVEGRRVDARSDLYAAGVTIRNALTGRLDAPWPALADATPLEVDVLRRMTAQEPDERPGSADDVLNALDDAQVAALPEIAEPEVILHGPTDIGEALQRPGTSPAELLKRWIRRGLLIVEDGRARRTVRGRERIGCEPPLPAASGLNGARLLLERGRLVEAIRGLDAVLATARWDRWLGDAVDGPAEVDALHLWLRAALDAERPHAIDQVWVAATRTPAASDRFLRLVEAARMVADRSLAAARAVLLGLGPMDAVDLEGLRLRLLVQAKADRGVPEREEVLDHARRWAERFDFRLVHTIDGWIGHLRYAEGRYADAARLHERAATGATGVHAASATLNAASAWMEADYCDRAVERARAGIDLACFIRHPALEARGWWLLRHAQCRLGERLVVRSDLVEAATLLEDSPVWSGLVLLGEAIIANNTADPRMVDIAEVALRRGHQSGVPAIVLLSRTLLCVAHRDRREAADLLTSLSKAPRDVAWQIAGALGAADLASPVQVLPLLTLASDPDRPRELGAPAYFLRRITVDAAGAKEG